MFDNFQKELYKFQRDRYLRIARRYYKRSKRSIWQSQKWEQRAYQYVRKYKVLWATIKEMETGERVQV